MKIIGTVAVLLNASLAIIAQQGDPKLTQVYTPVPPKIHFKNNIPTYAIVLFDGKDLNQ